MTTRKHQPWQMKRARGMANSVEVNERRQQEATVVDWPAAIARMHAMLDAMDDERPGGSA